MALSLIGEGDVWTENRKTRSGVIEKMYNKLMGGREVVFAAVFEFSQAKKYDVLSLNLKKILN